MNTASKDGWHISMPKEDGMRVATHARTGVIVKLPGKYKGPGHTKGLGYLLQELGCVIAGRSGTGIRD